MASSYRFVTSASDRRTRRQRYNLAMNGATSSSPALRKLLFGLLALFVVLHNDLWWWDDPSFVLGFPIALTYHLAYCLVAVGLMTLLARFAWPTELEALAEEEVTAPLPQTDDTTGGAP